VRGGEKKKKENYIYPAKKGVLESHTKRKRGEGLTRLEKTSPASIRFGGGGEGEEPLPIASGSSEKRKCLSFGGRGGKRRGKLSPEGKRGNLSKGAYLRGGERG